MRYLYVPILALALVQAALADPPTVEVPAEVVASGDYTTIVPKTNAKAISYVGLSGVDPFPSTFLKDSKVFILPTRGLKDGVYTFAGVASLSDEHTLFRFTVKVGSGIPAPKDPPVDPPVTPVSFYFALIRPDGPVAPSFERAMRLPGWGQLQNQGHTVKDFTLTEATTRGIKLPAGQFLPVVVTLTTDGKSSKIVRGPVPLPLTDSDIMKLPEGVRP